MAFPRYRISLSGGEEAVKSNNNIFSGLFSGVISSAQRSAFDRKYSSSTTNQYAQRTLLWYDPKRELSPDEVQDDERIEKGKIGVHASAFVWRALANLLQETIEAKDERTDNVERTRIIGLPNFSLVGLKQLADIINWMSKEEKYYLPSSTESKIKIEARVDEDFFIPTIILHTFNAGRRESLQPLDIFQTTQIPRDDGFDENIIKDRTKAWVDRVLVKMKICPFTKSTTKSGQGLGDVGVPVGGIAYHSSNAIQSEFPLLMAGKSVM